MAKADILFDKTEFVLRVADKQATTTNIRADQIISITVRPAEERALFRKIPSEVILIKMRTGGPEGMPLLRQAFENRKKGSWETTKAQILKFAKDNNIAVHEEQELWKPPTMKALRL